MFVQHFIRLCAAVQLHDDAENNTAFASEGTNNWVNWHSLVADV